MKGNPVETKVGDCVDLKNHFVGIIISWGRGICSNVSREIFSTVP